jgi:hypothetical protein
VLLDASLNAEQAREVMQRLQTWNPAASPIKKQITFRTHSAKDAQPANVVAIQKANAAQGAASAQLAKLKPALRAEFYRLQINQDGIRIEFHELPGLRAAIATLRQLLRQYGRKLPCLTIQDWPAFARRGVMLDVSRGRVPNLGTLLDLADKLADFKINELQLYLEHTFAYRNYKSIWAEWGALTGAEIRTLDTRCRELGIDLVPNQNSFGHMREFLASPKLKPLAEISEPWPDGGGTFWRYPSTFAPNHPGTLKFLRGLYDELLPNFSSSFFNVGCDETWDLGRGQSAEACKQLGRHRVYFNFLKRIHQEVSRRGKRMMFWGDIILHSPELIPELPKDVVALNWGYDADHPFKREAPQFARAGIEFYVCPGTSTWSTLIGKHDTAFANLKLAAREGLANGAAGYLITEWGDGGHPQPLAVAWLPFVMGAALAWSGKAPTQNELVQVASRDVFHDATRKVATAALGLGLAHRKLKYVTLNASPLGATLAAPKPETHELFCRDGLKYYARVTGVNVRATVREIERQRNVLSRHKTHGASGQLLADELGLAARMAIESGRIMLWQQALASGRRTEAKRMAKSAIESLRKLERDFTAFWPARNKATPAKCSPFFQWRMADYLCGKLHFSPEIARKG